MFKNDYIKISGVYYEEYWSKIYFDKNDNMVYFEDVYGYWDNPEYDENSTGYINDKRNV